MKVTALYGAMPGYDYGLSAVLKSIYATLSELGVTVSEINLAYSQIPFCDGIESQVVTDCMEQIKSSDCVIFATTSIGFSINAIMKSFMEHFQIPMYANSIAEKHCFIVTVAENYSDREVSDYLSRFIGILGGHEVSRVSLGGKYQKMIGKSNELQEIIEKNSEDFYRICKQNRKYIASSESLFSSAPIPMDLHTADLSTIIPKEAPSKIPKTELYQKINFDTFNEYQQKDIEEITNLFSKKLNTDSQIKTDLDIPFTYKKPTPKVVHHAKTCKQMTHSLPHYYQPHLAGNFEATIQLIISGSETFDCYLTLGNNECRVEEGTIETPDITILTTAEIWVDILKGKYTAQKAFMIGQLKVRGNFVLLTKLDQLFKRI